MFLHAEWAQGARQYLIDEMTGQDVGFVTSDDLDFIGKPNSIDYCARVMGVPFRKAKMDDNTINIAAAYIDWVDGPRPILFLLGTRVVIRPRKFPSKRTALHELANAAPSR